MLAVKLSVLFEHGQNVSCPYSEFSVHDCESMYAFHDLIALTQSSQHATRDDTVIAQLEFKRRFTILF